MCAPAQIVYESSVLSMVRTDAKVCSDIGIWQLFLQISLRLLRFILTGGCSSLQLSLHFSKSIDIYPQVRIQFLEISPHFLVIMGFDN